MEDSRARHALNENHFRDLRLSVQNMNIEHRSEIVSTTASQHVDISTHSEAVKAEIERLCSTVHPVYASFCKQAIHSAFDEALPEIKDRINLSSQSKEELSDPDYRAVARLSTNQDRSSSLVSSGYDYEL